MGRVSGDLSADSLSIGSQSWIAGADTEDLTQQVLVAIAGAIDRWNPGEGQPPFRAWLFRIARNAIVNAMTRGRPDAAAGSDSQYELLNATPNAKHEAEISAQLLREGRQEAFRWATTDIRSKFSKVTLEHVLGNFGAGTRCRGCRCGTRSIYWSGVHRAIESDATYQGKSSGTNLG